MNAATVIGMVFVAVLVLLSILLLFAGCPWTAVLTSYTAYQMKDLIDDDDDLELAIDDEDD